MRTGLRRARGAVLAVLLLGAAVPAGASRFDAILGIFVFRRGVFEDSAQGTSGGSVVALPSGLFAGTATSTLPSGWAPPFSQVRVEVSGNGAGSFDGTPLGGPLPIRGHVDFIVFGGTFLHVPLTTQGVGIGIGGTATVLPPGSTRARHTFYFRDWATGVYRSQWGRLFQGLDGRTPGGLGQLTLVSPTRVESGLVDSFSIVSILTLTFVPEPGTLILLGAGVAGLGWQGRRKTRGGARFSAAPRRR